jgi:hypothetical protein
VPQGRWSCYYSHPDGTEEWYLNDKCHREDGPALTWGDGTEHWFLKDKRHREDGPAITYSDGREEWYLNDKELNDLEITRHICETYGGKAV